MRSPLILSGSAPGGRTDVTILIEGPQPKSDTLQKRTNVAARRASTGAFMGRDSKHKSLAHTTEIAAESRERSVGRRGERTDRRSSRS